MRQSQEHLTHLQDIVLEANAACDSWEGEARRRAKYVADLEMSRLSRSNTPQILAPPARSSGAVSCLTFLKRSSTIEESGPRKKEAQNIQFKSWPHASKFGSSKLTLRREVISGSTYPTISQRVVLGQ